MIYLRYLWYVLKHKWYVAQECFSFGLYWRGLTHDLSKFLPSEFIPYAKHFGGKIQSGRDKTGYYKPYETGDAAFDRAWMLHSKRNSHHWQYWCLPKDSEGLYILEMDVDSATEMFCDWLGAGRAQNTKGINFWYRANRDKLQLHPKIREFMEVLIEIRTGDDLLERTAK